jgi:hypothetical protein
MGAIHTIRNVLPALGRKIPEPRARRAGETPPAFLRQHAVLHQDAFWAGRMVEPVGFGRCRYIVRRVRFSG